MDISRYLDPLKSRSLVDDFISHFEELILTGKLKIGQKLPSERDLAQQLGVSRPVVHEGLTDLAFKGLITMKPRAGTIVSDYRKDGSLAMLNSLIHHQHGVLDMRIMGSMLEMRKLFEVETARMAAMNRSDEHLALLEQILMEEASIPHEQSQAISLLDFDFHHTVALASENLIYPLVLNSFKQCYITLTNQFFADSSVVEFVFEQHKNLVAAIKEKDVFIAMDAMKALLDHGEQTIQQLVQSLQKQGDQP